MGDIQKNEKNDRDSQAPGCPRPYSHEYYPYSRPQLLHGGLMVLALFY